MFCYFLGVETFNSTSRFQPLFSKPLLTEGLILFYFVVWHDKFIGIIYKSSFRLKLKTAIEYMYCCKTL